MAIQLSVAVRNARLDAIEATTGTGALLELRTGAKPANCAAADAGTLLAQMTLPTDWMAAAASGTVALAGTWQVNASGDGDAAHFRIKDSGDTTCHLQGTVTATAGGGDLELDNVTLANGQQVTITGFTLTDGNA